MVAANLNILKFAHSILLVTALLLIKPHIFKQLWDKNVIGRLCTCLNSARDIDNEIGLSVNLSILSLSCLLWLEVVCVENANYTSNVVCNRILLSFLLLMIVGGDWDEAKPHTEIYFYFTAQRKISFLVAQRFVYGRWQIKPR